MIRAGVFSDFLAMAEHFAEENLKDPAAITASGVLEGQLRKLCNKHGIALPDKPRLDSMNCELAKKSIYGKNEQKQVTAWAGIRNLAAHGQYDQYTLDQVKLMIQGIRFFLEKNPI